MEYGGMAESLYNLAALTNNDRWAKAGDRFTKKRFVNPLALRRDELRGLHVNTHIPQVIAAARRYEISGDTRFHDVADFFWYEVVDGRSYVTGGTSNGESWQMEPRRLAAELKRSVSTAECCCSYNMLKLTRHLYSWTGDPPISTITSGCCSTIASAPSIRTTGHTQYYLSMTPGAWKTFNTEDKSFWCCTGTGVEEYSKLNDSIYWRDAAGVYVNLFIPSELNWAEKRFRLRQETKFPEQPNTAIVVTADRPVQLAMRIRIPRLAAVRPGGEDQWAAARSFRGAGQLPGDFADVEDGRPRRDGDADASSCRRHARRSPDPGIRVRSAGTGGRSGDGRLNGAEPGRPQRAIASEGPHPGAGLPRHKGRPGNVDQTG